jgi:hypothetical protein
MHIDIMSLSEWLDQIPDRSSDEDDEEDEEDEDVDPTLSVPVDTEEEETAEHSSILKCVRQNPRLCTSSERRPEPREMSGDELPPPWTSDDSGDEDFRCPPSPIRSPPHHRCLLNLIPVDRTRR